MKASYLIVTLLFVVACNTTPEPQVLAPMPTGDQPMKAANKAYAESVATEKPKEEDCDDKAKQKVEISETEVKLGSPDTGCKLE